MAKLFITCALLVLVLVPRCRAIVYTVGGAAGWDISADLSDWPSKKVFEVGDVLLFQYSKYHSIYEVYKDGYDSCNVTNAIRTSVDGNTSIPLTSPGEKYFICGVLSHCLGGMKLQVTVEGAQAPAPAQAPALLSPEVHPQAPPSPLFGGPSTENDDPLSPFPSGIPYAERSSKIVAWLCTIGTLLWVLKVGA